MSQAARALDCFPRRQPYDDPFEGTDVAPPAPGQRQWSGTTRSEGQQHPAGVRRGSLRTIAELEKRHLVLQTSSNAQVGTLAFNANVVVKPKGKVLLHFCSINRGVGTGY